MNEASHSRQTFYREVLIEHLFIGALLRVLWCRGPVRAEVMKPLVDDAGYDLVVESGGTIRHIQLKSSFSAARTASQKVHLRLREKPSSCVIWIVFEPQTMQIGPFRWFGSPPGKPLPEIVRFRVARHTKGDASGDKSESPMLRVVPKSAFEELHSMEEVVKRLFGVRV